MTWKAPLLIVNPKAGRNGSERDAVRAMQNHFGQSLTVKTVAELSDTRQWAAAANKNGHDLLVIAGGDGTINEAVTGMKQGGMLPLGILPTGSGNLLAQELGLPHNIAKAASVLAHGTEHAIDIGFSPSHQQYIVNAAAIGFGSQLFEDANQGLKNILGYPAYLVAALKHIFTIRKSRFLCQFDEHGVALFTQVLIIANSNLASIRFVNFGNNVTIDDGLLDVMAFGHNHIGDMASIVGTMMLHPGELPDRMSHHQAATIQIRTRETVPMTIDGETFHGSYLEVIALPRALTVIVPSRERKKRSVPGALLR